MVSHILTLPICLLSMGNDQFVCSLYACVCVGGVPMIRLGDREVEYNPKFRFYVTTKLGNPHYAPEVATKTTIVNFAVKEQGMLIFDVSRITRYCIS